MADEKSTKPGRTQTVVRNIGLLLSGNLKAPILDAILSSPSMGESQRLAKKRSSTLAVLPPASTPTARR
jgi:hypothetical protein